MLPTWVKEQANAHIQVFPGSDLSVLELSHRADEFERLLEDTKAKLRALLSIPDDFAILFTHGGATAQFDAIPQNFCFQQDMQGRVPVYLVSGFWSQRAAQTAQQYTPVDSRRVSAATINSVLDKLRHSKSPDFPYIYVTPNETIEGIEYYLDDLPGAPLVADMTSCLMTRPIDFRLYDLVFAGAQKTLGIAGLCVLIVRESRLRESAFIKSPLLDYRKLFDHDSRVNTPPVFAIDVCSLMLDWYLQLGGIAACERLAQQRSKIIYDAIDESSCFINDIALAWRSRLNVTFRMSNRKTEQNFLQFAQQHGLNGLAGHRVIGGIRASMYNAMPLEGAQKLQEVMAAFAAKEG